MSRESATPSSDTGSPTQCSATLSPRPASTCRSTQLYAALSLPPTNHFANGGWSQSRTRSHFWSQLSRSAASAQNASRSWLARSYASSLRFASSAIAACGSKRRSSFNRFERASSVMEFSPAALIDCGLEVLVDYDREVVEPRFFELRAETVARRSEAAGRLAGRYQFEGAGYSLEKLRVACITSTVSAENRIDEMPGLAS